MRCLISWLQNLCSADIRCTSVRLGRGQKCERFHLSAFCGLFLQICEMFKEQACCSVVVLQGLVPKSMGLRRWWWWWLLPSQMTLLSSGKLVCFWGQEFLLDFPPFGMWWRPWFLFKDQCCGVLGSFTVAQPESHFFSNPCDSVKCIITCNCIPLGSKCPEGLLFPSLTPVFYGFLWFWDLMALSPTMQ